MTLTDISDLLPLMPRAVDFVWHRGRVATQYDEPGTELPKPVLHFVLPLDASGRAEARAFLRDHGPHVVCYRRDPRGEGVLMIGLDSDALAKRIAGEELGREVPEGLLGQVA